MKKNFNEVKKEYDQKYHDEFNKTGVFWAFTNAQFDENKTHKDAPDSEYLSIGCGGYIHKSNKEKLDNFNNVIAPQLKKEFTNSIDINDLIDYELANHECYYTYDYSQVAYIISDYYNLSNEKAFDIVKKRFYENIERGNI